MMPANEPGPAVLAETALVDLAAMAGSGGVVWSVSPQGFHANLVVLEAHGAIGAHRNDSVDVLVVVLAGGGTAVQILTGFWLAHHLLGSPGNWFADNPVAHVVQVKLGLLALTLALAVHARFRVIPNLSDTTLPKLAWHIRIVTAAAVLFVLAGASIRFGGYPAFDR